MQDAYITDHHDPVEHAVASALQSRSSQYETGGRGPGTVSSGVDDPGGPSYGSYQLASRDKDKSGKTIHDSALIDNIYKVRIAYVTHIRDGYLAAAKKAKTPAAKALNTRFGQQFTNMLKPGGRFSDTGGPTAAQLM